MKQKFKIIQSLDLLAQEHSIGNIASRLGYESSSAFIFAFKKHMGCSPRSYRKRNHS
ncbi:helix-turn-helix domain-containing protein [Psychrobium sp. nBUS_13]|uniref:helix-turn-helix domain-containing protein n=1 Tax=Psychrobium sp. nBUS_13 TaxID=3395319 RepID=UPI003EBACC32